MARMMRPMGKGKNMEKKIKHRILGVFVVIGLIVLMLPFFQSSNELPSEDSLIKAPPFPSEAKQQSEKDLSGQYVADVPAVASVKKPELPTEATTPHDTVDPATIPTDVKAPKIAEPTVGSAETEQAKPVPTLEEKTSHESLPTAKKKASKHKPIARHASHKVRHNTRQHKHLTYRERHHRTINRATKHVMVKTKKGRRTKVEVITPELASKLTHSLRDTAIEEKGLVALKDAAWVVQVGSFKDRANAVRMVNKLRRKGYRTFLQHLAADDSENSRVFVGPELRQSEARRLAKEIERQEQIKGFVVSYKPLQL